MFTTVEKLWLSRYHKDVYFCYFYLVLKFSLPVELPDSKAMYFTSLSTPLNFAVKVRTLILLFVVCTFILWYSEISIFVLPVMIQCLRHCIIDFTLIKCLLI
jgi:hypothetical protein